MMPTILPVRSDADWEAAKAIRFKVFVDEQGVPPDLEIDELDDEAIHWLVQGAAGQVLGTARAVVKPDGWWKIGRVAVLKEARGTGAGAALMRHVMREAAAALAPGAMLESQVHALGFYAKLGFVAEGEVFLDAGIPHRLMRWWPVA